MRTLRSCWQADRSMQVPWERCPAETFCDIADPAMGMAFANTLAPEEYFTTVELKINFFRPIWQAQLRAEGIAVGPHHRLY